jgi:hypothetical protein
MKRYLCTEKDSYVYHGYYACDDVEPLIKALRNIVVNGCLSYERNTAVRALAAAGIPLEEPGEKVARELAADGTIATNPKPEAAPPWKPSWDADDPPDPALDTEQMAWISKPTPYIPDPARDAEWLAKISKQSDLEPVLAGIDRIIEALAILAENASLYSRGTQAGELIRAQKREKT